MFKWGRKKFDRITERWPKNDQGEMVAPVFFQHVQGTELDVEMAVNLLEAYGIPALRKAPGDGSFGEVFLGSSGYGVSDTFFCKITHFFFDFFDIIFFIDISFFSLKTRQISHMKFFQCSKLIRKDSF